MQKIKYQTVKTCQKRDRLVVLTPNCILFYFTNSVQTVPNIIRANGRDKSITIGKTLMILYMKRWSAQTDTFGAQTDTQLKRFKKCPNTLR